MHTGVYLQNEIDLKINHVKSLILRHFKLDKNPIQNIIPLRDSLTCQASVCIFDMFCSYINKAEMISPYAGDIITFLFEKDLDVSQPQTFCKSHMTELLSGDKQDMLIDAVNLAGIRGKIVVKKNITGKSYIELTNSYFFENLTSNFKLLEKEYLEARLVCIDGYIESVSEIHRLLEDAASTKENIFLFVRGLSDDVNHTLKVNYDRKTLVVVPIIVPFDLDGANIINDIAIISNNDVVSTNKGQLISCIDLQAFNKVDNIKIYNDRLSITNKNSYDRVNRHIKFLQEKANVSHEATGDIIAKRIQRLGTTQVTISIPESKEFNQQSFSLDRRIRSIKFSIDHGIIKIDEKIYPFSSYQTAKLLKEKLFSSLNDIGCIID